MTEERGTPEKQPGLSQALKELRPWKKIMLGMSVLLILGGILLSLAEEPTVASTGAEGGGRPGGPAGALVDPSQAPGGGGSQAGQAPADPWSAGLFRLGFSFFAAFCVGYAARATFKLIALGCGFAFLFLFVLSYVGLITVDWVGFDRAFESMAQRIADEASHFRTFITGSLPATGLAALGLYAGFRRR